MSYLCRAVAFCVHLCGCHVIAGISVSFNLTHWPGRCGSNSKSALPEHRLWIKFVSTPCEIALRQTKNTFRAYGKWTLLQVMAWCRQATNHYLSQCWPRSMSPYGVIRPQWVNVYGLANCSLIYRLLWICDNVSLVFSVIIVGNGFLLKPWQTYPTMRRQTKKLE